MKREIGFKITNEELYHSLVTNVDVSGIKTMGLDQRGVVRGFSGHLTIELDLSIHVDVWGEFGAHDYEDEYGFILTY